LLVNGPSTTEYFAIRFYTCPEQSNLRLPFKVLNFTHILLHQVINDISLIEKKGDDIFQSESLEAVEDDIREKLFLFESCYISINALNYLVNPELKPQAQPLQLLLAHVIHDYFSVISLLLV